jgi:aspartate dehydrogenase
MQRVCLLGCGNIAGIIASHRQELVDIVACHDTDETRMFAYAGRVDALPCPTIDNLLECRCPLMVEAASVQAVRDHLLPALEAGKDVVVLSVGALTDAVFQREVRAAASRKGRRVYIPSGAVFGLDNIKTARVADMTELLLRTTKAPGALGMPDDSPRQRVFAGKASEAVKLFPKNINVSAALGLAAGQEPDVEIWADPAITSNRHEIEARGTFGSVSIRTDNLPSPENPATSYLAALSVLTLLKNLGDPISVGT